MLFDTHTHIQFETFKEKIEEVLKRANQAGVRDIIACGTNLASSKKALELAREFRGIYAAVGIHPHHVFEHFHSKTDLRNHLGEIEVMLTDPNVLAVGEVGMDKHEYKKTKYTEYEVHEAFLDLQKDLFGRQINLALKYDKSLILHNRKAVDELLEVLSANWSPKLSGKTVLHFCEADEKLLEFAKDNHIFIGVDGDVTFSKEKQDFVKQIPLELLVLETDSPFIVPEPLRSAGIGINESTNLVLIAEAVARILGISVEEVSDQTFRNSKQLFNLP